MISLRVTFNYVTANNRKVADYERVRIVASDVDISRTRGPDVTDDEDIAVTRPGLQSISRELELDYPLRLRRCLLDAWNHASAHQVADEFLDLINAILDARQHEWRLNCRRRLDWPGPRH